MLTERDRKMLQHIEAYKGITITQAYRIFFKDKSYGMDYARKRLKILNEQGFLKYKTDRVTRKRVYYTNKAFREHDMYIMDFYSWIMFYGGYMLDYQPNRKVGTKYSDGYFKFKFQGHIYPYFLEVNLYNKADMKKYEEYFESGEIQKELNGKFPIVAIVTDNENIYKSKNFNTVQIGYDMKDFSKRILFV